jgi:osmotically-inducible protein OsmY
MRSLNALMLSIGIVALVVLALVGCRREEEAPAEGSREATGLVVPDTTIMREIATRLDVDPRLDQPDITLEPHSKDGEVTLVGTVPSRFELSIAREIAMSTPGVRQVWLDSVRVLSEERAPEEADTSATSPRS